MIVYRFDFMLEISVLRSPEPKKGFKKCPFMFMLLSLRGPETSEKATEPMLYSFPQNLCLRLEEMQNNLFHFEHL